MNRPMKLPFELEHAFELNLICLMWDDLMKVVQVRVVTREHSVICKKYLS